MKELARLVATEFGAGGLRLITAESCTGGMIAAALTDIPGSSEWFEGAFVTYRVTAKISMLGVASETIRRFSAVSEPVAKEMAVGALLHSAADVSVSVTGVAGPSGGDPIAPVGRVWLGFACRGGSLGNGENTEVDQLEQVQNAGVSLVQTECLQLTGDRRSIREQAARAALLGLLEVIRGR